MTLLTALRRLDRLKRCEVEHCIQRIDSAIKDYELVCANYTEYRMLRYGMPFKRRLESQRQQFVERLEQLK